jgi:hypothetical protein
MTTTTKDQVFAATVHLCAGERIEVATSILAGRLFEAEYEEEKEWEADLSFFIDLIRQKHRAFLDGKNLNQLGFPVHPSQAVKSSHLRVVENERL